MNRVVFSSAARGEYTVLCSNWLAKQSAEDGATRSKDAVFLVEPDGVRILHSGNLAHTLATEHLAAISHVAKEYSTLDWIMEGLLTRAGFRIEQIVSDKAPLVQYVCGAEG